MKPNPKHTKLWLAALHCALPLLPLVSCKSGAGDDMMNGTKAGETRSFSIADGVTLDFQWIPPGEFAMGSPANEFGRSKDELQTKMLVHNGFWMSTHEIRRITWHKIMKTGFVPHPHEADRPVDSVAWNECQDFVAHLAKPAVGWKFALPAESQWEYACRAGSKQPFYGMPADIAWLDSNSGSKSHLVGLLPPNRWGLRDMHGNVAEWCRDRAQPDTNNDRVIRGGSWDSDLSARAAARNSDTPHLRTNRLGFRIIIESKNSVITNSYKKSYTTI